MRKSTFALTTLTLWAQAAQAGTYTVTEGQEVAVAIDPKDTVIVFPTYVQHAFEAEHYHLKELSKASADGKLGVKSIRITAKTATPQPERIKFILANDKQINVLVTPMVKGDSSIELKFPPTSMRRNEFADSPYLRSEMALMLTMLRDDNAANRRVLNEKVKIPEYPQLSLRLVRDFRVDGLTGFVFLVENTTKETLRVNHTILQFGRPNRAVMIQMDHETLEPCSVNNSAEPRGTGCVSAMRLVLRGQDLQSIPQIHQMPRAGQTSLVVAERGTVK